MEQSLVDEYAAQLIVEREQRHKRKPLANVENVSIDDAYAIQRAVVTLLKEKGEGDTVGYKIALTSPAMQQMVGVDHPLAGEILTTRVLHSPHRISLADFQKVGLEFEIAVQLNQDLPPVSGGHTRDTVAAAVEKVAPAFELVEDRDADYDALDAPTLIADNAWNAGNILGEFRSDWQRLDLAGTATRLTLNGVPEATSVTGDAMGHPFDAVAWIANLLNEQGRQLQSGMFVMTGSSITTRFPQPGQRWEFSVDGFEPVTLDVDA